MTQPKPIRLVTFGWNGSIHDQHFTSNPMELLDAGRYEFLDDSGMLTNLKERKLPLEINLWAIPADAHCLRHGFDTLNISKYDAPVEQLKKQRFLLTKIRIDADSELAGFSQRRISIKSPVYAWIEPEGGWEKGLFGFAYPNSEKIGPTTSVSLNLMHVGGNPTLTDDWLRKLLEEQTEKTAGWDFFNVWTAQPDTASPWSSDVLNKALEAMAGVASLNTQKENEYYAELLEKATKLSDAAYDTLMALYKSGPLSDGDVPSKVGRNELLELGLANKAVVRGEDGYQVCSYSGRDVVKALRVLHSEKP